MPARLPVQKESVSAPQCDHTESSATPWSSSEPKSTCQQHRAAPRCAGIHPQPPHLAPQLHKAPRSTPEHNTSPARGSQTHHHRSQTSSSPDPERCSFHQTHPTKPDAPHAQPGRKPPQPNPPTATPQEIASLGNRVSDGSRPSVSPTTHLASRPLSPATMPHKKGRTLSSPPLSGLVISEALFAVRAGLIPRPFLPARLPCASVPARAPRLRSPR